MRNITLGMTENRFPSLGVFTTGACLKGSLVYRIWIALIINQVCKENSRVY